MSSGVHTRVWENAQFHGTTLLFLLALADEANDHGEAEADVLTLAKKARTTERHVRRLVDAVDAMDGCSAVLTGGRVRASLTPYAVTAAPVPMVVLAAEPTPTDGLSSADEMSVADEMSGRNVRGGRNVRAAQPANTPPLARAVFSPPPLDQDQESQPSFTNVQDGRAAQAPTPRRAVKTAPRPKPAPKVDEHYGARWAAIYAAAELPANRKHAAPQHINAVTTAAKAFAPMTGEEFAPLVAKAAAAIRREFSWRSPQLPPTPAQLQTEIGRALATARGRRSPNVVELQPVRREVAS